MKVAIVGVALRLPKNINSLDLLWDSLINDNNLVTCNRSTHRWPDSIIKQPFYTNISHNLLDYYGKLNNIDLFDRKAFGLTELESINLDPQHRLMLELTWQVLEEGNYAAFGQTQLKAGVFAGLCSSDYNQLILDTSSTPVTPYNAIGNTHSTAAGRISHTFNLSGPSLAIDTACSSSNVALNYAVQSLNNLECECAVVTGTNLIIHPSPSASFAKAGMLSPEFRCKPFEVNADGYVRSEGAVALLLKPLDKAKIDKNKIYASIESSVINHDGHTEVLTSPNSKSQVNCIRQALFKAKIKQEDISFLETHGTGTQVGDKAEVETINTIFKNRSSQNPLYLGATKSLTGHTETVSGLVGIVNALLIMKHRLVPGRHLNKDNEIKSRFNPSIIYPSTSKALSKTDDCYVGINCYGFSGTNSHVILKSYDDYSKPDKTTSNQENTKTAPSILAISSYSNKHLKQLALHYTNLLKPQNGNENDIIESIKLRANYFQYRVTFSYQSYAELIKKLVAYTSQESEDILPSKSVHKKAFVFTGQGFLPSTSTINELSFNSAFKTPFEICMSLFKASGACDLKAVINSQHEFDKHDTIASQAVIFSFQYAMARLLKSIGVQPDFVAGHSLGQYAASVSAGIIKLDDAITLVTSRAKALKKIDNIGSMMAIGEPEDVCKVLLAKAHSALEIAAINSPKQTIVSGNHHDIKLFKSYLERSGINYSLVDVQFPFHSRYVDQVLSIFRESIKGVSYQEPNIPIESVLKPLASSQIIGSIDYWVSHLRSAVNFKDATEALIKKGASAIIEIGCGGSLLPQLKATISSSNNPNLPVFSFGSSKKEGDLKKQIQQIYLAGVDIKFQRRSHKNINKQATWPFNKQRTWLNIDDKVALPSENKSNSYWSFQTSLPDGTCILVKDYELTEIKQLMGHRIGNNPIMPAAEYLNLFLYAINQLGNSYQIRNFSLPTVLTKLNQEFLSAQMHIGMNKDRRQVSIYLRDSHTSPLVHTATAEFILFDSFAPECKTLTSAKPSTEEDQSDFYRHLKDVGLDFSGAFRCLSHISKMDTTCIGYFTSNDSKLTQTSYFDMPFQCISFICRHLKQSILRTGSIFVPSEIARIQIINIGLTPSYCVVQVQQESETEVYFNATIYDSINTPVFSYKNAKLVRITAPLLTNKTKTQQPVYIKKWKESPLLIDKTLEIKSNVQYICLKTGKGDIEHLFNFISNTRNYAFTELIDLQTSYETLLKKAMSEIKAPTTLIIEKCSDVDFPKFVDLLRSLLLFLDRNAYFNREICIVILSSQEQMIHPSHKIMNNHAEALTSLIKTLCYEFNNLTFKIIDTDQASSSVDSANQIFDELHAYYTTIDQAREQVVALRSQTRFVPVLSKVTPAIYTPPSQPSRLIAPVSHHIDDLIFKPLPLTEPSKNEVQVKVCFTGIIFRDILKVLGQYPSDDRRLGCEYSGLVTKVGENVKHLCLGQRVAGLHFESFASHINVSSGFAVPVHKNINLAIAASLPVCSLSVSMPVSNIDIPPESAILIHSASGGLGNVALEYFSSRGHKIFATSHGARKKHFLCSRQMTAHADSRSNNFKSEFLTQGQFNGVFLALYTLPSESVQATIECIQPNGYLIDYTKNTNINKQLVTNTRPDITYLSFDLEEEAILAPTQTAQKLQEIYCNSNPYNEMVPITTYDAHHIKSAFHLMTSAKHIGKVVIKWGQQGDEYKSVLITGGSGYLAEQLAIYYAETHEVILVARSLAIDLRASLSALISSHQNIHYLETDITDYQKVEHLFKQIKAHYYPVDTIVHAAGEINDGIFLQQDANQFKSTYSAKCLGAENLHWASKQLDLDQFVLISSVAAMLGSPGQSNYAAANGFLSGLSLQRTQQGLPSKTLLFGPYKETTMVSDTAAGLFAKKDIIALSSIDNFIEHYKSMIKRPESILLHAPIQWHKLSTFYQSNNIDNSLFKELDTTGNSSNFTTAEQEARYDLSNIGTEKELKSELKKILIHEIESILEPSATYSLDFNLSLKEQGIDSLLSVELSAAMEYKLSIEIPPSVFSNNTTPNNIIDDLVRKIELDPKK